MRYNCSVWEGSVGQRLLTPMRDGILRITSGSLSENSIACERVRAHAHVPGLRSLRLLHQVVPWLMRTVVRACTQAPAVGSKRQKTADDEQDAQVNPHGEGGTAGTAGDGPLDVTEAGGGGGDAMMEEEDLLAPDLDENKKLRRGAGHGWDHELHVFLGFLPTLAHVKIQGEKYVEKWNRLSLLFRAADLIEARHAVSAADDKADDTIDQTIEQQSTKEAFLESCLATNRLRAGGLGKNRMLLLIDEVHNILVQDAALRNLGHDPGEVPWPDVFTFRRTGGRWLKAARLLDGTRARRHDALALRGATERSRRSRLRACY